MGWKRYGFPSAELCSLQIHDLLSEDDTKHAKGDRNRFSVSVKWPRPVRINLSLMTMYNTAEHQPSAHWGGGERASHTSWLEYAKQIPHSLKQYNILEWKLLLKSST